MPSRKSNSTEVGKKRKYTKKEQVDKIEKHYEKLNEYYSEIYNIIYIFENYN